jgi:hypothetical protein
LLEGLVVVVQRLRQAAGLLRTLSRLVHFLLRVLRGSLLHEVEEHEVAEQHRPQQAKHPPRAHSARRRGLHRCVLSVAGAGACCSFLSIRLRLQVGTSPGTHVARLSRTRGGGVLSSSSLFFALLRPHRGERCTPRLTNTRHTRGEKAERRIEMRA